MGQFFNSIKEVSKNYSKYDDWEQKQADERAQKEYLVKNLEIPEDKVELTNKKAETVVRATEMMDARSEDNCQNMEQLTGMLSVIPTFGLLFAQEPIIKYLDKKLNGKTKNQIHQIQEELKNCLSDEELHKKVNELEELNKKSLKISKKVETHVPIANLALMLATAIGMILWSNSKQKEASRIGRYQAKHNELKGVENFIVYTPEQIEKAQELAKKIPDEKDRNPISKMIKELKDVSKDKKAYKEWLASKDPQEIEKLKQVNLSPEQLLKANEDKELIVDTVKEINIKAEEYSENVENAFDTLSTLSWLIAIPLGMGVNKIMKMTKVNKKIRPLVSMAIPIITPLGIAMASTLEEKKASRVGRYKARQDILKNPSRLMAFSDEDMKKAEQIKAPEQKQGFWSKIGDSFGFLGRYYKDKREYNKYKKTHQKENEKLQKALKQVETTDVQKAQAKDLQKNVFRAFDEIDEMSQRYSEDVEAGCEIAKEVGVTAWSIGAMVALALAAVKIEKGKFPITKLTNWLTNRAFKESSSIKTAINGFWNVLKSQDKSVIQKFQHELVHGNAGKFLDRPENKALKDAAQPIIEEFEKLGKNGYESVMSGKSKGFGKTFSNLFKEHLKETALAKWTRSMLAQCSKLWARTKVKGEIDIHDIARNIKQISSRISSELKSILNSSETKQDLNEISTILKNSNNPQYTQLADLIEKAPDKLNKLINNAESMSEQQIRKELNEIIRTIEEKLGTNITYKNYKTLFNTGIAGGIPILGTLFGVPYAFNAWLTNIQKKSGKIGIMKAMDKIDDPRVFASDQPIQQEEPTKQQTAQQTENKSADSNLLSKVKKSA